MAKTVNTKSQFTLTKSFCNNTTIPALGYLTRNSKLERIFWLVIIFISLLYTILLTKHIFHNWSSEAVFITLDASSHLISKVDFPAVAICNINKISKHRAVEFANNLSRLVRNRNHTEILNLLQAFGNLYNSNVYGDQNLDILQEILDNYDKETPLKARLLTLGTPCNEILLNCSWNSIFFNCSDLFQTRLTDSGYCCIFNYVRPSSRANVPPNLKQNQHPKTPNKFIGTGVEKGLSVTINNNISDYFYTDMATRGFLLKIFSPVDFPDLSSGSLKQIIVQEKSEVFVKVEANTLKSQKKIRVLPINSRKCKFSDEEKTAFGKYTSSNGFVSCKIRSVLSLCNCVPFMLPIDVGIYEEDISFCTLVDVPCLNKYRDKWLRYYPNEDNNIPELHLEFDDSLDCNCFPNCNDVTYAIDTNYFGYYSNQPVYQNSSKIHVFSSKAYTNLYKKMATVTWYEGLSNFGGIVSLFLGVSNVNLVEIGVFLFKLVVIQLRKCF